ncbi:hypothetical protein G9A89_009966 [Geosiphon pyriformis]|nr:hypothetical protein G9A89_009966 [Geosiphon pyriformis]
MSKEHAKSEHKTADIGEQEKPTKNNHLLVVSVKISSQSPALPEQMKAAAPLVTLAKPASFKDPSV